MEDLNISFEKYKRSLKGTPLFLDIGKVTRVVGQIIEGFLPGASLGSVCRIFPKEGSDPFLAEVVGLKDKGVLLLPLGELNGVALGSQMILERSSIYLPVGNAMLGRILDGMGQPIDGGPSINSDEQVPIYNSAPNPLLRESIKKPLDVGVKVINGFVTIGRGQRMGIMAGSGVGKSVLLGMMAKNTEADINVIALIGERGREVKDFIENSLGEEGLKKSVIIVATSDQSPLLRKRGAFVASAIAEFFCSKGKNVLLMMDSVTRFAMAQREIGLSAGEPPASKGYTPSVFSLLPRLLERAGNYKDGGSITGIYTVLVEGDDMDEPIADSVRSIVDGHIVMDRKLAHKNHYPAIDVLQSTSRVMAQVSSEHHVNLANELREVIATYRDSEDLINIGAYKTGMNEKIDRAIHLIEPINNFLKQNIEEISNFEQSLNELEGLANS